MKAMDFDDRILIQIWYLIHTVFDLISERTLISGHPKFFLFIFFYYYYYYFCILIIISSDFREGNTNLLYTGLMVTMVKTIARAHRLCYCIASCYCVESCNRYLMLINHPTVGATRGLTLREGPLIRSNWKKKKKTKKLFSFFWSKNLLN